MGTMVFEFDEQIRGKAKITVVGVGGAGCNAINSMIGNGLKGVEFIAVNTDAQALEKSLANNKVQIGIEATRGLGAGANPEMGRLAMEETKDKMASILSDSDMVFIAAGMGGGTGTGAAPVIAQIAQDMGALTVAIVTKPFRFEGGRRMKNGNEGLGKLKEFVDTLIVIHNQRLLDFVAKSTSMIDSFEKANDILYKAVRGITDLITITGHINLDFSDVKTIMQGMGDAMMGVGEAEGDNRCIEAAQSSIQSTLLENIDIKGAKGVLVNISGGTELTLWEINEAMDVIYQTVDSEDANVIFGTVIDPEMEDKVRVTVIATGFDGYTSKNENDDYVNKSFTSKKKYTAIELDKNESSYGSSPELKIEDYKTSHDESFEFDSLDDYDNGDYDIPAFLRNNKD